MTYLEVVRKAQNTTRFGSPKVPFTECDLWEKGDQINLWTYWQGYQIRDIDDKGVDILLVGQDWGNPLKKENAAICKSISKIQAGDKTAFYSTTVSPTDKRLARLFKAFGDSIDILKVNPGIRLFFTNYSLGYRKKSETGGMTKTIMRQDKELFDDLVVAIKPKIIICLGKITFEVVSGSVVKGYSSQLKQGRPIKSFFPGDPNVPVYGVSHAGSRGLYNVGGDEITMFNAWKRIAEDYYSNYCS